jgi:protocatechuate 3,4-dioxygenase, beta subunit
MSTPAGYRRDTPGAHPPYDHPAYESTRKRAPHHAPIRIEHTLSEITGPTFSREIVKPGDADLTHFDGGEAIGERIIVTGRVLDEDGRAIPRTLIEIWQANAAGRYSHDEDRHDAPLDPQFSGVGKVITDGNGAYRFITIKPGAYPWRNHHNAWRPNHIHFSLFGPSFATRLITQMYFPGDPLLALDPIFNSVPDRVARDRLIAAFDIEVTIPESALGYRFDFVLRGRDSTPME